jgi:hypothetical protein
VSLGVKEASMINDALRKIDAKTCDIASMCYGGYSLDFVDGYERGFESAIESASEIISNLIIELTRVDP